MTSNSATVCTCTDDTVILLGNSETNGAPGKSQQAVCGESSAQTLSIPVSTVFPESVVFKGY